jgi:hypothetical protein
MSDWTPEQLRAAWLNTTPIHGSVDRLDCDGRRLKPDGHGREWQVDHIVPESCGGTDRPSNLRARHKEGNALAGGLLGNAMKENRLGLLGALASDAPPRNAMADAVTNQRRNALAEALTAPANRMWPYSPSDD